MDIFIKYIGVFGIGGLICLIGQMLMNKTKMTSARILVIFLLAGVLLESLGLFKYIEQVGGAGARIPIIGFGAGLARGAIEGAKQGLFEAITGGLASVSGGLSAAIIFGFIFALIFKSHSKKM